MQNAVLSMILWDLQVIGKTSIAERYCRFPLDKLSDIKAAQLTEYLKKKGFTNCLLEEAKMSGVGRDSLLDEVHRLRQN